MQRSRDFWVSMGKFHESIAAVAVVCVVFGPNNHMVDTDERFSRSCEIVMMGASALTGCGIQEYMGDLSTGTALSVTCTECSNELVRSFSFTSYPPLLCIVVGKTVSLGFCPAY